MHKTLFSHGLHLDIWNKKGKHLDKQTERHGLSLRPALLARQITVFKMIKIIS